MLFSHLLGGSPGLLFDLYSWTHSLAFYSGLACRPADLLIALFRWSLFPEGLQSWLGGLASLAFCVLFFFCGFLLCFMGNHLVSVICLSRDWARCRAALGAKKKACICDRRTNLCKMAELLHSGCSGLAAITIGCFKKHPLSRRIVSIPYVSSCTARSKPLFNAHASEGRLSGQ